MSVPPEIEPQRIEQNRSRLILGFAENASDLRAAQQLRFKVFAEEMGAQLASAADGFDHDRFDPYCDHLLVRDERDGRVVGTYRILRPEAAERIGGYYSETEFDLTRLQPIRHQLVELGRSCVDPEYRSAAVIGLLFAGIAQFMTEHRYEYLIGCASVSLGEGVPAVANLYLQLRGRYLVPEKWRVKPLCPLPLDVPEGCEAADLPSLVKSYLNAGAYICGPPALDAKFNAADLPLLLPMARLDLRYVR